MVNLKIDGKNVVVPEGTTILDAAKQAGIDIPTLCFLKEINEVGDCRMCIVEVEGRKGFATSCIQKVEEGMVVHTHTPNVLEARHTILDLIISNHTKDCLTCTRSGNCELQDLAIKFNVLDIDYKGERTEHKIDDDTGGAYGCQGLGSECFSYDHGIGQGVEKLKQISKDHRDRKFQQGAERISDCQTHFFF